MAASLASRPRPRPAGRAEQQRPPFPVASTSNSHSNHGFSTTGLLSHIDLDPSERVKLMSSTLSSLIKISIQNAGSSEAKSIKDITLSILAAAKQIIEERVAKGRSVPQEQIDDIERAEVLVPAVMESLVTVFDGTDKNDPNSISSIFGQLGLEPLEKANFIRGAMPSIMKALFGDKDSSAVEKVRDVALAVLTAARHIMEERLNKGKTVTQEEINSLQGAEGTVPAIMDSFVAMFNGDSPLSSLLRQLDLDTTETAKFVAATVPSTMKAIFGDINSSPGEKVRNMIVAQLPAARMILEERRAKGIPVSEQQKEQLQWVEQMLPVIMDSFVVVIDLVAEASQDAGAP